MSGFHFLSHGVVENWPVWLLSAVLVVAAAIDGWKLKVPNWITFPLVIAGVAYNVVSFGWPGLGLSLVGAGVGLALLLPAYAVGGMGAGDVKLLAGVGAWVGPMVTLYAFCVSAIFGGIIAVAMVLAGRNWRRHFRQFWAICNEFVTVGDPGKLSAIAAERKSSMMLLPYGIPIALGYNRLLRLEWDAALGGRYSQHRKRIDRPARRDHAGS